MLDMPDTSPADAARTVLAALHAAIDRRDLEGCG
jgi:hypothetical protein